MTDEEKRILALRVRDHAEFVLFSRTANGQVTYAISSNDPDLLIEQAQAMRKKLRRK